MSHVRCYTMMLRYSSVQSPPWLRHCNLLCSIFDAAWKVGNPLVAPVPSLQSQDSSQHSNFDMWIGTKSQCCQYTKWCADSTLCILHTLNNPQECTLRQALQHASRQEWLLCTKHCNKLVREQVLTTVADDQTSQRTQASPSEQESW